MQEVVTGIDKLKSSLLASFKESYEAQKQITEKHSILIESVQNTVRELAATNKSLDESQELMQTLFQESLTSFEENVKAGLTQSLTSFDNVLGDILERFSGTLAEMREQYEALEQHTRSLSEGTETYSSAMNDSLINVKQILDQSQAGIQNLVNEFVPVLSKSIDQNNQQAASIEKHQEKLNDVSSQLDGNLKSLIDELNHVPQKVSEEIRNKISDLQDDFSKELNQELVSHNKLLIEIREMGNSFKGITSGISSSFNSMNQSMIDISKELSESIVNSNSKEDETPKRRIPFFRR